MRGLLCPVEEKPETGAPRGHAREAPPPLGDVREHLLVSMMKPSNPAEAARSELFSIFSSGGAATERAKQSSDRLAGLGDPSDAKVLGKQLEALMKDLEACGAQIDKIGRLAKVNPRSPGSLAVWLKALELPPNVDQGQLADPASYEYMKLVERVAGIYINAWQYRQRGLKREVLMLQSRVDYAPLSPHVEAIGRPAKSGKDAKALQAAVRRFDDRALYEGALRFRPDLPALLEDAKRRLTEYLVLGYGDDPLDGAPR